MKQSDDQLNEYQQNIRNLENELEQSKKQISTLKAEKETIEA
jgi:phage shock protein A